MLRLPEILLTVVIGVLSQSFVIAQSLPRATPESQGVSSEQILKFIEAADKEGGSDEN